MRVTEVKAYTEKQVPYKYVMNEFHSQTPDNCCAVLLSSAGHNTRNVSKPLLQFLVRNKDPEQAEKIAFDLFGHFDNKSDFKIGEDFVVFCRGQQSVPLYTGTDDAGRHIYSVNIQAIVDNTKN